MQPQTLWPPSQLHENAKAAFDARATDLASSLVERPMTQQPDDAFPSRHSPSLTIMLDSTPDDWIAEITDFHGRTKGRYFLYNRQEFAIIDRNYEKLRDLSIDIIKKSPFNFGFSVAFIEKSIFKWIKLSKFNNIGDYTEHLYNDCLKNFKPRSLLVPLDL